MEWEAPDGDESPEDFHFLSFTVGSETCAVELAAVREIIRVPAVVGVPLSPPVVEGIINLRSQVVPVISARRALGFGEQVAGDDARIVVLYHSALYGLLVDAVAGVVAGQPEPLQAAQENAAKELLAGTLHVDDRVVMLLDPERLVPRGMAALTTAELRPVAEALVEGGAGEEDEGFRYLTFLVSDQEYGLPVDAVREIGRLPGALSRVPHAASHLLGVAKLRGQLLPMVDLPVLLGLPATAPAERRRVLILDGRGSAPVGMVVDGVREVLHSEREAEALPPLWDRPEEADLQGMLSIDGGQRLVAVLAADRLLQSVLSQLDMEGFAMAKEEKAEGTTEEVDTETLVVFVIGEQEFAVPVADVREILRVPEQLARVPGAADFVEGMINLRGQVLSVLDQRRRLGLASAERSHRQRILVLEAGGNTAGFAVDAVREVVEVPRSVLGPAPKLSDAQARMVRQVANLTANGRMILVLAPEELLRGAEIPQPGELAA